MQLINDEEKSFTGLKEAGSIRLGACCWNILLRKIRAATVSCP